MPCPYRIIGARSAPYICLPVHREGVYVDDILMHETPLMAAGVAGSRWRPIPLKIVDRVRDIYTVEGATAVGIGGGVNGTE